MSFDRKLPAVAFGLELDMAGRPWTVARLEDFGRTRLSRSFFMRDFLYSEISQIEGIPNVPDDPELAIEAGKRLCQEVLEAIQERFGRIAIRSAFRAAAVNARGAANKNQYNCASNEANYASHIWDHRDAAGHMGATACIVVPAFLPYYERTFDWAALAWWVHDNVPGYSHMQFYPKLAAFNVSWHERPEKRISSWMTPRLLTKPGMDNHGGSHIDSYREMLGAVGMNREI
ncbi:hypothetical protein PE066_19055 [Ramlibacter tataouinensis]|uniref:hypothetical protein n=1 Tax=Ramlibacter tataouinensis TaxID=94132 RepID=UPI0022F3C36D|nr:hypothetical protein [Ramlibacter tataouinensis]WBY01537.1 hypothetical protein PE066_19055 [Ramlibacter tataouinensis]